MSCASLGPKTVSGSELARRCKADGTRAANAVNFNSRETAELFRRDAERAAAARASSSITPKVDASTKPAVDMPEQTGRGVTILVCNSQCCMLHCLVTEFF